MAKNVVINIAEKLCLLRHYASAVFEESFRITLEGPTLDCNVYDLLLDVNIQLSSIEVAPVVSIDGESASEYLHSHDGKVSVQALYGCRWKIIIGKTTLAAHLAARESETTVVFFSESALCDWLVLHDPFRKQIDGSPSFDALLTFRVFGLKAPFGGSRLWVLPLDGDLPEPPEISHFPSFEQVHSILHVNTTMPLCIDPASVAIEWGDLSSNLAKAFLKLSAVTLASTLAQEIKNSEDSYSVVIRGTKRITLSLAMPSSDISQDIYQHICNSVTWIFSERPDTRHQLIMDRLSIDIEDGANFLDGLSDCLGLALEQAKDSYLFVILDRKDAYYKETRDILKDMRSQADLYASKTRDLVSAFSRDLLGVIVFIGFSFISKFDRNNIFELLNSRELNILVRVLSMYYVISMLFQVLMHQRDSTLAYEEATNWTTILNGYTSRKDIEEKFMKPINKRRHLLQTTMIVSIALYSLISIFLWHLPSIISYFLI